MCRVIPQRVTYVQTICIVHIMYYTNGLHIYYTHACTHTCTCTHTHTHTHASMHTHMHIHLHSHTHTHTCVTGIFNSSSWHSVCSTIRQGHASYLSFCEYEGLGMRLDVVLLNEVPYLTAEGTDTQQKSYMTGSHICISLNRAHPNTHTHRRREDTIM